MKKAIVAIVTTESAEFKTFFAGLVKKYHEHCDKEGYTIRDFHFFTEGKRYIKVCTGIEETSKVGSSYCFIDKTNGNVLKPASWSSPAKHARGNIFDADNGLDCCGPYGVTYLRGGSY